MKPQCLAVLQHLQTRGSITQREALRMYGISRLASRISDLKEMGYDIGKIMKTSVNRYGDRVRFARYYMIPHEEENNDHQ